MNIALTELISGIGTPQFALSFYQFWRDQLPFQQLTAWRMSENTAPVTLIAERPGEKDKIEGLCELWINGSYLSDPFFTSVNTKLTTSILTLHDFDDNSYRSRFFIKAGLSGKLAICQKIHNEIIYMNFYRRLGEANFTSSDEKIVVENFSVALACLKKHSQFIADNPMSENEGLFEKLNSFFKRHETKLSNREAMTCAYAILGHTHESIALNLGVSKSSAMTYRTRAYKKLGATGLPDLFALYLIDKT